MKKKLQLKIIMKIRLISKKIYFKNYKKRFLEENYTFFDLPKTQEFIIRINQLPLSKEEKLKIVNYKPENIAEISVVSIKLLKTCFLIIQLIPKIEEKLNKNQVEAIFQFIKLNKKKKIES